MNNVSNQIYSRRKRFLPEYRELFAALLKIPDKDVRDRVTDAINGIQSCPNCRTKQQCQYIMNVATQTEISYPSMLYNDVLEKETIVKPQNNEKQLRRRKRKRNCPKVVKTAQYSGTLPILKQTPNQSKQVDSEVQQQPLKLMQCDSDDDALSVFFGNYNSNALDIELQGNIFQTQNNLETIKRRMKIEWETCDQLNESGYLPIHEAIVQNEILKLKRQLYVWKFRKWDLNTLTTEDNHNLIQLAIKSNCIKGIFDVLLKEELNLDDCYDDGCNIIHLAVTHLTSNGDVQEQKNILQIFEQLLKKIDLKILLEKNDDGLTPLHIAVKNNEYLMIETILNVINERLNLKNVVSLNNPSADIQMFLRHYSRQCENFEGNETNNLKQEILNARDMKRGCSVLYFAMELGYDHLIYLLLAHMCNPTIKNFAGLDAKTYYTELGKNARIVGVIEQIVDVFILF